MINFIGKRAKIIAARHFFLQGYIDKNLLMHARMHREIDNANSYTRLHALAAATNIDQPYSKLYASRRFPDRIAARQLSELGSPSRRHFRDD